MCSNLCLPVHFFVGGEKGKTISGRPWRLASASRDDHLHTADHPTCEAHLYAVRVSGRMGEDLSDGSLRQSTGTLILFLDNLHPGPWLDVSAISSVHPDSPQRIWQRAAGFL
jgi:hypothetical protein